MSLDAVWLRTGYEPALEPGKETAGLAELVCKERVSACLAQAQ
jgi:hypothetical protein